VGPESELNTGIFNVHRLNWISIPGLDAPRRVQVKIRHVHEPSPALIEPTGPDQVKITFDEPQRAITPGHSAVFYDGIEVVGGGWIL
jgi:tRNA-specific 2-thiouridylase